MKFRDFQHFGRKLHIFNLNDIRKIDPNFHRQQLGYWLKSEYVKPFANGYYLLSDAELNENSLFMLANRIYEPSYISLESALAYYSVIPESVLGLLSVSSRKTQQFESDWGRLIYRSIKPFLLVGYRVIEYETGAKFKIASLEKAVLDYLYFNNWINSADSITELRWNKQEIIGVIDNSLFSMYLRSFQNSALEQRVNFLREYVHA